MDWPIPELTNLLKKNSKKDLNDGKEKCPRCFSDKIRKDTVEWTNTATGFGIDKDIATLDGMVGKATYKDEIKCNVCGYWINDPNDEKPKGFMTKFFVGLTNIVHVFINGLK